MTMMWSGRTEVVRTLTDECGFTPQYTSELLSKYFRFLKGGPRQAVRKIILAERRELGLGREEDFPICTLLESRKMSNELANVKPSYLANLETPVDNSDLNMFSRPPRIKIVQAMSQPPIKPPFKDGDIIVTPQNVKIGDMETPFTFVPIHFFPTWICLNPLQMKGTLPSIREFSMDPESELAKKCKDFKLKEKCPENPEYVLKYSETLNFMIVIEDIPELADMPIHLFFSRGEYMTGQKFIGDIQLRKAPRYACRFRAASNMHTNKQSNRWHGLDIFNDSKPWVEEADFFKYKALHEEFKKLVDTRTVELDLADPENAAEAPTEF